MIIFTHNKSERILTEWKENACVKVFNASDVGEMIQFLEQETGMNNFIIAYERGIFFIR